MPALSEFANRIGAITVASQPGAGSEFTVTLPSGRSSFEDDGRAAG